MDWQTNKCIALDDDTQRVIMKALCDVAGVDQNNPEGEHISYVPHKTLDGFKKFGTACGTKGNTFSFGMIDLLRRCEHILMCYRRDNGRIEILSMAVLGISQEDGVKMGLLAKLAGCSLRAEPLTVGKESWVFFESE